MIPAGTVIHWPPEWPRVLRKYHMITATQIGTDFGVLTPKDGSHLDGGIDKRTLAAYVRYVNRCHEEWYKDEDNVETNPDKFSNFRGFAKWVETGKPKGPARGPRAEPPPDYSGFVHFEDKPENRSPEAKEASDEFRYGKRPQRSE